MINFNISEKKQSPFRCTFIEHLNTNGDHFTVRGTYLTQARMFILPLCRAVSTVRWIGLVASRLQYSWISTECSVMSNPVAYLFKIGHSFMGCSRMIRVPTHNQSSTTQLAYRQFINKKTDFESVPKPFRLLHCSGPLWANPILDYQRPVRKPCLEGLFYGFLCQKDPGFNFRRNYSLR